MSGLTSDKPLLSRPTNQGDQPLGDERAINCTTPQVLSPAVPEIVADLVRDSLAPNSRRAYASDIAMFKAWGGWLPATETTIADYLSDHAASHAPTTLRRWLSSLSKAHRAIKAEDPTRAELVRSVLRGIRRRHGKPLDQARPLTRDLLFEVLDSIQNDPKGKRDRALLLIGFAGGFRRSELVGLDVGDVARVDEGLVLTIRRSKTDQIGQGRRIGMPFARGHHCPVRALQRWLEVAELDDGALFRAVSRHGTIANARLSGEAVSLVIKDRLIGAKIDSTSFSGHSLRAGFITSAAQAGIASWKIRQQTGHASDGMLARYIRDTEMFVDNAAGVLL